MIGKSINFNGPRQSAYNTHLVMEPRRGCMHAEKFPRKIARATWSCELDTKAQTQPLSARSHILAAAMRALPLH